MKYLVRKDKKNRKIFKKTEEKKLVLKAISCNKYLDESVRMRAKKELKDTKGYLNKLNNRCILTGRGKGIVSSFRISRMCFKELVYEGKLAGIRKSSW